MSGQDRSGRRRAARASAKAERQTREIAPDWIVSAVSALTLGIGTPTNPVRWHYHNESREPDAVPCVHLRNAPAGFPETLIILKEAVCGECGAVAGGSLDEALEGNVVGRQWWWAGAGRPLVVPLRGRPADFLLESHCPVHGLRSPVTVGQFQEQTRKMLLAGHANKRVRRRV